MNNSIITGLVGLCLFGASAYAQTVTLVSTTTTAAMTSTQRFICLTANTGIVLPSAANAGTQLFIDSEQLVVQAQGSTSLCYVVTRQDYPAGHVSGSLVYIGAPGRFYNYSPPNGTCVLASMATRPWINVSTGVISDCVGSKWVQINNPQSIVASAQFCGVANACAATRAGVRVVSGISAALDGASPSVVAITGISPPFTSTTTFACTANAIGTGASTAAISVTNTSASAVTFYSVNGGTALLAYSCVGY